MLTGDQLKEKLRGPVVAMTTHFKEDYKDSSGDFAFYRAHSQLLEGKVATMGSAGMNYYLWGHEFGSSCFLTGLGNIWPRWEIEFYDHLAAGWYCTY